MTTCPTDSFFPYDYICTSFLKLFKQNIITHLTNHQTMLEKYAMNFPCELSTVYDTLNKDTPLYKLTAQFGLVFQQQQQQNVMYATQHAFLMHVSHAQELEHYLTQIKRNCFDIIFNFDIQKGFSKLESIQNQLIKFSEDIITIKHLIFKNNCEYYGEVKKGTEIKNGFGCLLFKDNHLIYLGIFVDDVFTSGIIVEKDKNTIYKGKFNKDQTFEGIKIVYNDSDNKIEHFFFGKIILVNSVYTGCSIKYIHNRNDNSGNNSNNSGMAVKISYFNENTLTLTFECLPNNVHKIIIMNKEQHSQIQYSNEGYLLKVTNDDKGNVSKYSILSKIKNAYYIGDLDNNLSALNGNGIVIYESGNYYKGDLKDNMKHGKGVFVNETSCLKYEGEFHQDEFVNGRITNTNNKHLLYEGELKETKPTKGRIHYANGDTYEGEINNYMRHGHGIYNYNSTTNEEKFSLECKWENNIKKGPVVFNKAPQYKIIFDESGKNPQNVYDDSKEEESKQ